MVIKWWDGEGVMKYGWTPLVLTVLIAALLSSLPARAEEAYSFGVLSQRSALLTAQYWNPILDYLSRRTGLALTLKVARTAPESNAAIEAGEYDFVYSNTIFRPAAASVDYRVILRPRTEAITGQIVVRADTPLHSLADLAGHEVGFPSQAAFVGYAVPMDHLLRQGIAVTPVFGGNQEGVMGQLKAGRVVAAGVNSEVMRAYAARENLEYRVLWESPRFHNLPVAAHPRVPEAAAAALRAAFAAMTTDAEGTRILETSGQLVGQAPPYGFLLATPADYANYSDFYRTTLVRDIK